MGDLLLIVLGLAGLGGVYLLVRRFSDARGADFNWADDIADDGSD